MSVVSGPRKTARNSASVRRRVHHMRGPSHSLGMTEGKVPSPLVPKLRLGTRGAPVNPVQQEIPALFASSAVDAVIASLETKWLTELLRLPRQKLCIVWQRV